MGNSELNDNTKVPIRWIVFAATIGLLSFGFIVGGVWWAADLTAKVNTLVAAKLADQSTEAARAKEMADFREKVNRDLTDNRDRFVKELAEIKDKVLVLEYRSK